MWEPGVSAPVSRSKSLARPASVSAGAMAVRSWVWALARAVSGRVVSAPLISVSGDWPLASTVTALLSGVRLSVPPLFVTPQTHSGLSPTLPQASTRKGPVPVSVTGP